jgi:hypothetical protein
MEGKGQLKIGENMKISLPKHKLSHQNLNNLLLNALKNYIEMNDSRCYL